MDDLISRQAAIDALGERPIVWTDDDQYTLGERNQYDIDRLAIETLPSAQPNLQNQLATDCISRQDALDALKAIPDHNDGMVFETLSHALRDIELLPSAQVTLCHLDSPCEYQNADIAMPSAQPEIVRCKECKWWDKKDGSPVGYCHAAKHGYYSEHWEIEIYRTYKEDFYCADGEREGEE